MKGIWIVLPSEGQRSRLLILPASLGRDSLQEPTPQRLGESQGRPHTGQGLARNKEGEGTHSETCTKMSSEPFSGVMKPWPWERENCLQTPLNTGPAEARAVLGIGRRDRSCGLQSHCQALGTAIGWLKSGTQRVTVACPVSLSVGQRYLLAQCPPK